MNKFKHVRKASQNIRHITKGYLTWIREIKTIMCVNIVELNNNIIILYSFHDANIVVDQESVCEVVRTGGWLKDWLQSDRLSPVRSQMLTGPNITHARG